MNIYTKSLGPVRGQDSAVRLSAVAAFLDYFQETTDYHLGRLSAGTEESAGRLAQVEERIVALEARLAAVEKGV